jgi:uncharacterized membrane protein (UPF0182 family)
VSNNARVRLTTNTSGVRYSLSTIEAATVEDAIAAIVKARETATSASNTPRPEATRPPSDRPMSETQLKRPDSTRLSALVTELLGKK